MGFPADWRQEVEDLIDVTSEDIDAVRAVQRMESAIQKGLPTSQAGLAHFVLGVRYEDLERNDEAMRCYTQAIELGEQNPMVYWFRAELFMAQGSLELARADLLKCLSFEPPHDLPGSDREHVEGLLRQLGTSE